MFQRIAVIGDVHGDAKRLDRMFTALKGRGGRTILVGDYVDRRPESAEVVELLMSAIAASEGLITALAGNHEAEFLSFVETGDFVAYAAAGGMATIRSYVGVARGDVHRQFVAALPGGPPRAGRVAARISRRIDCLSATPDLIDHGRTFGLGDVIVNGRFPDLLADGEVELPRPTVICGHYVQSEGRPFVRGGFYCVDTGCGTIGRPLTALLLPEEVFVTT